VLQFGPSVKPWPDNATARKRELLQAHPRMSAT
jgi:hypothetical protein